MTTGLVSRELLDSLEPNEFADYVRALGWKLVEERPARFSIWQGPEAEVLVPLSKMLGDYYLRLSDAVSLISEKERVAPRAIVLGARARFVDVLRVRLARADHADRDGTMPLRRGAEAVAHVRDLMEAAASAAVRSAAVFHSVPSEAREYLSDARLGQTEVGSYVITVHSRLPSQVDITETTSSEPPFPRKVLTTLATALHTVKSAIGEVDSPAAVQKAVQRGVSSNLCRALSSLGVGEELATLEFNVSWAPAQPAPVEVPRHVSFPKTSFKALHQAAKFLARSEPEATFTLVGPVRWLEKEKPTLMDEPGSIAVLADIDGRPRQVLVRLKTVDYVQAIHAHEMGSSVSVVGTLRHLESDRYVLDNPMHFKVL